MNAEYIIGNNNLGTNPFKGYIDDIRFINKVSSDSDVDNIYNDITTYVDPYTILALGKLEMNQNKIPMFNNTTQATTIDFLDESNLESDSQFGVPTQHSVKTYVDTTASNLLVELEIKEGEISNFQLYGEITDQNLQLPFNSNIFRTILNVNKDLDSGILKISSKGLMKLEFTKEDTSCKYYLVRKESTNF